MIVLNSFKKFCADYVHSLRNFFVYRKKEWIMEIESGELFAYD